MSDYCYKTTAIKELEITKTQFEKLGLEPDKMVRNPHYKSGPKASLYLRERIEKLKNTEMIEEMRNRRRTPQAKDYSTIFNKRYDKKEDAIPDACEGLFNLNRYAKHLSCSSENREEIYSLKTQFIEFLYKKKLATSVMKHERIIPERECYYCRGDGINDNNGEDCHVCDGTGVIDEKILEFVCFSFDIAGQKYTWHQPIEYIDFSYKTTDENINKFDEIERKDVEMANNKFKEKKELIKWILKYDS